MFKIFFWGVMIDVEKFCLLDLKLVFFKEIYIVFRILERKYLVGVMFMIVIVF